MKIVVIGGTGLIGTKLVNKLKQLEHEVIAASPSSGINTLTGHGLNKALEGADVVVDVSNSPSFEDKAVMDFFQTSGHNLIAAETSAGVNHHVALSVVGTERLQDSGYFRAKLAQEKLIKQSNIPYSILHSTQFFEFAGSIVKAGTDGEKVVVSSAFIQPIASDNVVEALADIVVGKPLNKTVEVAGPQKFHFNEFIQKYMSAMKDGRELVAKKDATYFGVRLNDNELIPGANPILGTIHYDKWISNPENQR